MYYIHVILMYLPYLIMLMGFMEKKTFFYNHIDTNSSEKYFAKTLLK